jgi:hypothetical protein
VPVIVVPGRAQFVPGKRGRSRVGIEPGRQGSIL